MIGTPNNESCVLYFNPWLGDYLLASRCRGDFDRFKLGATHSHLGREPGQVVRGSREGDLEPREVQYLAQARVGAAIHFRFHSRWAGRYFLRRTGIPPGRYVFTQIAELPFLGDSAESMSVAYQRIHERHFAKLNEYKGLKVIAVFTHGAGNAYNTKHAINTIADLQGLKFRAGGGMVNEIGKALGANVTVKPATESYALLSTGVMDGVFFPAETIASMKLDKLIRYATVFPGGLYNTSFALVMNEDAWKRIPKADQDIVAKFSGEHAARLFGRGWDEVDKRGKEAMVAAKVQAVTASKELVEAVKAKTSLVDDKWFADAKAKGLPNPQQVLQELRAEIAKAN